MIHGEIQNSSKAATIEAEKKFKAGIFEMKKKNFVHAAIDFSEAIALLPTNCLYRIKRCECLMAMKTYDKAVEDALRIVEFDDKCRLGYYKLMDCYLMIGRIADAEEIISKFRTIEPKINSIDENQVVKIQKFKKLEMKLASSIAANDHLESLKCINEILKIAPASIDHQFLKVQHLVLLEKFCQAKNQRIGNSVSSNIAQALQYYYYGDLKNSTRLFQRVKKTSLYKIKVLDDFGIKAAKLFAGLSKGRIRFF